MGEMGDFFLMAESEDRYEEPDFRMRKHRKTSTYKPYKRPALSLENSELTEKQIKRLFAIGYSRAVKPDQIISLVYKRYGKCKFEELTKDEYAELCTMLEIGVNELSGKIHRLKTLPEYFTSIENGTRNFEIRLNDRDFQIRDILKLEEYKPNNGYTGRYAYRQVTYILNQQPFVPEGYVCMSIVKI